MILLLEKSTRDRIEKARAEGVRPTPEQQTEFLGARTGDRVPGLAMAGDRAEIQVRGVLTQEPDFLSWFLGLENTTYPDINAALAAAQADPDVKAITLAIDSPGGEWDGLFSTVNAINGTTKPITARVDGLGASAAYAIASQADSITAANQGVRVGSVGVAIDTYVYTGGGIEDISITSSEAPEKRPDLMTAEGKAAVQAQLDELHDLFVTTIAAGRAAATGENFDAARINKDFGRGATVLAEDAKRRGMVDAIADSGAKTGAVSAAKSKTAPKGGEKKETRNMDKETLKTEHPAVYAAIRAEGHAEGVTEGAENEKKRVSAHLKRGQAVGAMDVATKAIEDGTPFMDDEVQAEYLNKAANKADAGAAAADDGAVDPPPAGDGDGAPEANAIDLLEASKGVKHNG